MTPHQGDGNAVYRAKKDRSGQVQASMSEEMRDATDEAQKYLEMVRTRGEAHANPYRVYEEIASNMTDGNLLKPDWRALFRETGTQGSGGDVWKRCAVSWRKKFCSESRRGKSSVSTS